MVSLQINQKAFMLCSSRLKVQVRPGDVIKPLEQAENVTGGDTQARSPGIALLQRRPYRLYNVQVFPSDEETVVATGMIRFSYFYQLFSSPGVWLPSVYHPLFCESWQEARLLYLPPKPSNWWEDYTHHTKHVQDRAVKMQSYLQFVLNECGSPILQQLEDRQIVGVNDRHKWKQIVSLRRREEECQTRIGTDQLDDLDLQQLHLKNELWQQAQRLPGSTTNLHHHRCVTTIPFQLVFRPGAVLSWSTWAMALMDPETNHHWFRFASVGTSYNFRLLNMQNQPLFVLKEELSGSSQQRQCRVLLCGDGTKIQELIRISRCLSKRSKQEHYKVSTVAGDSSWNCDVIADSYLFSMDQVQVAKLEQRWTRKGNGYTLTIEAGTDLVMVLALGCALIRMQHSMQGEAK